MRRQRGAVFVVAIFVVAGLVAVLASVAATHQSFVRAEANRLERDRSRVAAEAGVQYAMQALFAQAQEAQGGTSSSSASGNQSTTVSGAITLNDAWATLGEQGAQKFVLGNSSFRMQVIDLASRVNLNTAPQAFLERLPLTNEQVEALLDFREAGEEPRAEGGKDQYYNGLPEPYNAKLRGFDTLDELMHVKGFTAKSIYEPQTDIVNSSTSVQGNPEDQPALSDLATVYSYSPETTPTGEAKVNVNGGDQNTKIQRLTQAGLPPQIAQQIAAQNWPTLGQLLTGVPGLNQDQQRILLDNATTTAEPRRPGRINLNTVTEPVLNAVPGLTPDIVSSIIQRQQQGFASLGEIMQIPGITPDVLQQSIDLFSTSSQTFLVRIVGTSGQSSVALEAIVDMQQGRPKIIQVQDVPYNDYLTRWQWGTDTTSETPLKEARR